MLEGILERARPIAQGFLDILPRNLSQKTRIIAFESYATLRHTLPLSLHWFYQRFITHEIVDVSPLVIKKRQSSTSMLFYISGYSPLAVIFSEREKVIVPG